MVSTKSRKEDAAQKCIVASQQEHSHSSRDLRATGGASEISHQLPCSGKAQPYVQFGFVWELPCVGKEQTDLLRATSWYTRQL